MKKLHFFVILIFQMNSFFAQIVYVNANNTKLVFDNVNYHTIYLDLNLDNTVNQHFSMTTSPKIGNNNSEMIYFSISDENSLDCLQAGKSFDNGNSVTFEMIGIAKNGDFIDNSSFPSNSGDCGGIVSYKSNMSVYNNAISAGTYKTGFRVSNCDPSDGKIKVQFGYLHWTFLSNKSIILHGWYFNSKFNVGILVNETYSKSYNSNDLINPSSECNSSLGLEGLELDNKEIVKVVDFMGRETEITPNTSLIYIYSDGTRKRVMQVID